LAFDIGKALKVATIPIVILVAIELFSKIIMAIPLLNMLMCVVGVPLFIASLVVLAWAGFKAVKEAQMDIIGGALAGGIAGFVSSLIGGIVGLVLSMLGIGAGVALGNNDVGGAAIDAGMNVVGVIIGIGIGTVMGLIFGAVGAFVAGMKK
jgi:hypothetical protein